MNNLHRSLAPMSQAAWDDLEETITDRFTQRIAGRRIAAMPEPKGYGFSALPTGTTKDVDCGVTDVVSRAREQFPVVELRIPFTVSRTEIDNVLRGDVDVDWSPAEQAAEKLAEAEDAIVFTGMSSLGIRGIKDASREEHEPITLPDEVADFPLAVTRGVTQLRLAGIEGPYKLLLSSKLYQAVSEGTDYGNPVYEHILRMLKDGQIIWAPNITDAVLLSDAGDDFELHLGQDVSVGYDSHDADNVHLYLEETLTFRIGGPEAAIVLTEDD